MDNLSKNPMIFLLFRIGIFLTFFGHGCIAFSKNKAWIPYLEVIGFSKIQATSVLPLIGIIVIIVALTILIKPFRLVVLWAAIWAFSTALIRPISGEPVLAFIERGGKLDITLNILFNLLGFNSPLLAA